MAHQKEQVRQHKKGYVSAMDTLQASTAMMDTAYLAEHDVIQRYIRGQLNADELSTFEILLITNPALIDEIEMQRVINASFREQLSTRGYKPGFYIEHVAPLLRRGLPLAAGLMVALLVVINTSDSGSSLHQDIERSSMMTDTVVLQALRSGPVQQSIDFSALAVKGAVSITLPLHIDVGPQLSTEQRYNVVLVNAEGTALAQATALTASADGWLDYRLELASDVRGFHHLQVTEATSGDQQGFDLNFR